MEKNVIKQASSIVKKDKDGVQAIIRLPNIINRSIYEPYELFKQEYLIVQDKDDRGLGNGNCRNGLPGGAIEEGETPLIAILRELGEEVAIKKLSSLREVGCYDKLRPSGFTNKNHLFFAELKSGPVLRTNDPKEVSKVYIRTLREMIYLASFGCFHEGSIRLMFYFLNGTKTGLLNRQVSFHAFTF